MEGEPTRKKSKVDEIEENSTSTVHSEGDSGGEERMKDLHVGDLNRNYLTPALMDVWPQILDNVTDPKDVVSLMNASPDFHRLLKKRKTSALLAMVLPILLNQNPPALTPRDVFNCRLVNNQVKASADKFLAELDEGNRDRWVRTNSFSLQLRHVTQAFMNAVKGFTGNPFLARYCEVNLCEQEEQQLNNRMEILRKYGHELHEAELRLFFDFSRPRGSRVLKRVLGYLPNVKSLDLRLYHYALREEEDLQNYSVDDSDFPLLEKLSSLTLCYQGLYNNNPDLIPAGSFLRPFLKKYGNQLTDFFCGGLVLKGELWQTLDFPNLLDLELEFILIEEEDTDTAELSQIYTNLAKLCCPKLEKLFLCGDGMRLTAETFLALNNFRKSLQFLDMANLEGDLQLFQVNLSNIRKFPKLTELVLCSVNVGEKWIPFFRVMFPNLEEIRFDSKVTTPNSRITTEPPVPNETLCRTYYTCFPKLKWFQGHSLDAYTVLRTN